jgi:hypothetical protein
MPLPSECSEMTGSVGEPGFASGCRNAVADGFGLNDWDPSNVESQGAL